MFDTATNTVTATMLVGAGPYGVAVHPAGTFVYVTNPASNSLFAISTATNTVVAGVPVGKSPLGVAVHPAGTFVYVANEDDHTVSVKHGYEHGHCYRRRRALPFRCGDASSRYLHLCHNL